MTDGSHRWQELDSVLDRVLDGIYDDRDLRRLNEILRDDVDACGRYVHYVELHGRLAWGDGLRAEDAGEIGVLGPMETVGSADQLTGQRSDRGDPPASQPFAPIIIQTSPDIPPSFSPVGSFLFSYAVAAVAVAIGLLIGWSSQVSTPPQQIANEKSGRPAPTAVEPTPAIVAVGQVTGMFDCQWSEPSTATIPNANVPLGRRYALASGLMEISYDTGARVILQGPCIYEVVSKTGGYLAVGRVTARVEKRAASGSRKVEAPASGNPVALFSVHTPSAVITDLGTEFGVEVDESGASRAHVFRGKVEVRAAGGNGKVVALSANESARVDSSKHPISEVVRQTSPKTTFVREMPKSAPVVVFNTGIHLKAGDRDPHWQIVARSDDKQFKPQPAVVRGMKPDGFFLEDDPARSRWLSLVAGDVDFPQDVVFVFRTTFDLTGMLPSTAVLRGRFLGDDRVTAIRLNGRRLSVSLPRDGGPFVDWITFQVTSGFVKGTNVLEFDVLNADPFQSPSQRRTLTSRMSFRAELEAGATRDPGLADGAVSLKSPRTPPLRNKTASMDPNRLERMAAERDKKELPSAVAH